MVRHARRGSRVASVSTWIGCGGGPRPVRQRPFRNPALSFQTRNMQSKGANSSKTDGTSLIDLLSVSMGQEECTFNKTIKDGCAMFFVFNSACVSTVRAPRGSQQG